MIQILNLRAQRSAAKRSRARKEADSGTCARGMVAFADLMIVLCCACVVTGCSRETTESDAAASTAQQAPLPTNRIDVPAAVRKNLGLSFATVESRHVARIIRVPGRFELTPEARREYRTMLGGRVELHVEQYDRVEPGALLYTLDSPGWRELQERLNETEAKILQAQARADNIDPLMAAHARHHDELEIGVAIWTERVEQLEQSRTAGVVTAEEFAQARAALATTRAALAEVLEKEAVLRSQKAEVAAELRAARERFELLLMNAASLLGVAPADLTSVDQSTPLQHPRWREVRRVEVRAASRGIIEALAVTNGAWAAETDLVLTTVQPELVRFRARGLQSDLGRLRDGLPATIVPPSGGSIDQMQTVRGIVHLGIGGDPDERTIELVVTPEALAPWVRPGMAAHLEITTDATAAPELAIPMAATIRDGLRTVFFRRDPANPDQVVRVDADLGLSDGRWVVVYSGVKEGDEVVVDGVYQLMLATSGTMQKGGHFHADGTFHKGNE